MKNLYHDSVFYLRTNSWEAGMRDVDAYEKIKERSLTGEPEFIVLLSWYIALGKGCEKNVSLAVDLLQDEAVKKSAGALCAAGLGFLRGYYGRADEISALSFFDQAEELCIRKGSYQKGMMLFERYLSRRDNLSDLVAAGNCFEKAAKNGHATSLNMHAFCRTGSKVIHLLKFFFVLGKYFSSRASLGGPERWWCYRDLEKYRPTAVELAEGCGHALGYFAKDKRN